ncbi:helicase associated domain-containing protein [Streptomyces sp. NPDC002033]|uniref:helicase associated domain-containing protein n=1 Tax=unclassified Streptomyces TaxID=2593676 RepID=UPI00331C71C4
MTPAERPTAAARGAGKAPAAFQRGVAAPAQYIAREGHHRVPRGHAEQVVVEGEDTPALVKLGVWTANTKTRRDRLTEPQRTTLLKLGVEWA